MIPTTLAAGAAFKPVDPGAVEKELQALWRARAEALKQAAPEARPLGRSLLHTLVVYAPDAKAADRALALIAALSPHQPGRMILLRPQPAGAEQPDFEAAVRLNCAPPQTGQEPVCCEHVVFVARGPEAARRLPSAALPLLVTDVPSFLYWTNGNPFRSPILRDLVPAVDRLIVDSFTFAAPDLDLADVVTAVHDPRFLPKISDMSWARLAGWRYLTAQIFDPASMRTYLKRVRSARLSYYAGTPVLAWLFGGWLAARLGWRCVERDAQGAHYAFGQRLDYEPLPPPEAGQAGFFAGVTMTADDGATFEVMRTGDNNARTRLALDDHTFERVVPLKDETVTVWLGHELGRLSAAQTYEEALAQLVEGARTGEAYAG